MRDRLVVPTELILVVLITTLLLEGIEVRQFRLRLRVSLQNIATPEVLRDEVLSKVCKEHGVTFI